jgi:hypothetical protein
MIYDDTQYNTSKIGADTLSQWFAKVYSAIKTSHGQNAIFACPPHKGQYQKSTKEKFYIDEIDSIGYFKQ